MLQILLGALGPIFSQITKNVFPDPADELKRLQVQAELQKALIDKANEIELAGAEIVKAEAASGNWLASSWRPITMLVFVGLIVARWFGWAAPNLSPEEYLKLWDIVQLGLGGYVIGRSAEKIVPAMAQALKGKG